MTDSIDDVINARASVELTVQNVSVITHDLERKTLDIRSRVHSLLGGQVASGVRGRGILDPLTMALFKLRSANTHMTTAHARLIQMSGDLS